VSADTVEILVPDEAWGESLEGVMLTWIYKDGAQVTEGKVIAEMMVEKAQIEVLAPASGRLTILAQPETVINRSFVIGRIAPV